ncbi:AI-2E family transporter [Microbacterium imperiale]|uniref:AI-2E family transporter n=1 Tax=Microbacterium imperiale TaxID=33884 RepID=A0A9W6M3M5_9MICO|nr:AI-2E family transporter [Microbacterium imperiale]MBP2420382.1 putative PurR-regulated permease PerM [Microbacterium imperiale]MDS0197759.1 AI-2E family transporter [Microbacterium imperiale]BFE40724.1 AI-2E family transporter [Microbacterium imperiale]GLJ80131.1 AI-2E family transporter [Microbacterium imperiale]
MSLFRRRPAPETVLAAAVERNAERPPTNLWADGFGRLAIRSVQIIILVIVAIGVVYVLRQVSVVAIPLILALIFACAFAPAMNAMRRRGVPSVLATIITLLTIVVLLSGLSWLIVWAVRDQWDELYSQAQEGFQQLLAWAQTLPFAIDQAQIDEWLAALGDFVTSAQFGSGALAGVSAVATFITGAVLMVVILFFFLKDGPRMWEFLMRPFRGEEERRARRIGDKTVVVLGSYIRGTATVAAVDAIGIYIFLVILQVPLAIPLAVLVFLLAFIPIVGATLAGILAALVALVANGPVNALFVVGAVVLVNQLEGNFLQPVLMGRTMKLHSFVVLVALAAGTAIGGILGTLLAVPITAVAWGIVQVWDGPNLPARWARPRVSVVQPDDRMPGA